YYYSEAVRTIRPSSNQLSLDLAMYYQNMGIVHAIQGRLDTALHYMALSAGIREKKLADDDPDLAYSYTNLGRLHRMLGDDPKAFEYNRRAESIYIKHFGPDYPGLGTLYLNTGNNLKVMGDYERAVSYYRKALHIYNLGDNPSHPNIARIYNNLGAVYLLMDEDSLAEGFLSRSLDMDAEGSLQTITLRNLAHISQRKGDYSQALLYLHRAGEIVLTTTGDARTEKAKLALDYGLIYKDMGLMDEALAKINESLLGFQEYYGEVHPDLSEAYVAKASLLLAMKEPGQALTLYHQALKALLPGFTEDNILSNPVYNEGIITIEVLDPILGKADALMALASQSGSDETLWQALQMLVEASALADALRNQLAEYSKQLLTRTLRSLYEQGIALTYTLHRQNPDKQLLDQAFRFTEKSKYAVLLSSLRDVEAREFGGIPDSLREEERLTRDRITAFQKLINEEKLQKNPDARKISGWENTIFELRRSQTSLLARFEKEYPKYYSFKYSAEVLSLPDLQQKLSDDDVLVQYFLGKTHLYSLFVSKYAAIPYSMPLPARFEEDIHRLRASMSRDAIGKLNRDEFAGQQDAAYALYSLLLQPAEAFIRTRNLIIIPDDVLGYLSFDYLLTKPADNLKTDFRELPYLIRRQGISYSYLATLAFQRNPSKAVHKLKSLGFAPDYSGLKNVPLTNLESLRGIENDLPPLENAKKEMEMLQMITHGKTYLGPKATEGRFKAEAIHGDVIHLAMHTIINEDDPMLSKLAFQLPEKGEEDGLLNTYEIYNMDFDAEMVVLSACNTGTGQLQKGEGIISLARAFKYAGVPNIVMTLWAIEDRSGSEIMEGFYENLKQGQGKREALRNSKLDYLATSDLLRSHPYFWAAYVTIGDDSPLYKKRRSMLPLAFMLLIVGSGPVLFYRIRRRLIS
ncbi:MAG: CHAT domain-containing protein, partial [Bacteroidales bacterium]|nr:CHAT domain-containing protein [Bacteroidales bacterium]